MAEALADKIGLLRTVVRNLERTPVERPPGDADSKTTIRPAGHTAFNQLSERLMAHSEAMERGTNFANFQAELFSQVEAFVGRDPEAIGRADAQRLVDHFTERFKSHASPRRVFVPCVLTPWAAPRFEIGPVTFVYIDEITTSDFYPAGPTPDVVAKHGFT